MKIWTTGGWDSWGAESWLQVLFRSIPVGVATIPIHFQWLQYSTTGIVGFQLPHTPKGLFFFPPKSLFFSPPLSNIMAWLTFDRCYCFKWCLNTGPNSRNRSNLTEQMDIQSFICNILPRHLPKNLPESTQSRGLRESTAREFYCKSGLGWTHTSARLGTSVVLRLYSQA